MAIKKSSVDGCVAQSPGLAPGGILPDEFRQPEVAAMTVEVKDARQAALL